MNRATLETVGNRSPDLDTHQERDETVNNIKGMIDDCETLDEAKHRLRGLKGWLLDDVLNAWAAAKRKREETTGQLAEALEPSPKKPPSARPTPQPKSTAGSLSQACPTRLMPTAHPNICIDLPPPKKPQTPPTAQTKPSQSRPQPKKPDATPKSKPVTVLKGPTEPTNSVKPSKRPDVQMKVDPPVKQDVDGDEAEFMRTMPAEIRLLAGKDKFDVEEFLRNVHVHNISLADLLFFSPSIRKTVVKSLKTLPKTKLAGLLTAKEVQALRMWGVTFPPPTKVETSKMPTHQFRATLKGKVVGPYLDGGSCVSAVKPSLLERLHIPYQKDSVLTLGGITTTMGPQVVGEAHDLTLHLGMDCDIPFTALAVRDLSAELILGRPFLEKLKNSKTDWNTGAYTFTWQNFDVTISADEPRAPKVVEHEIAETGTEDALLQLYENEADDDIIEIEEATQEEIENELNEDHSLRAYMFQVQPTKFEIGKALLTITDPDSDKSKETVDTRYGFNLIYDASIDVQDRTKLIELSHMPERHIRVGDHPEVHKWMDEIIRLFTRFKNCFTPEGEMSRTLKGVEPASFKVKEGAEFKVLKGRRWSELEKRVLFKYRDMMLASGKLKEAPALWPHIRCLYLRRTASGGSALTTVQSTHSSYHCSIRFRFLKIS